jgi:hypothetical protein
VEWTPFCARSAGNLYSDFVSSDGITNLFGQPAQNMLMSGNCDAQWCSGNDFGYPPSTWKEIDQELETMMTNFKGMMQQRFANDLAEWESTINGTLDYFKPARHADHCSKHVELCDSVQAKWLQDSAEDVIELQGYGVPLSMIKDMGMIDTFTFAQTFPTMDFMFSDGIFEAHLDAYKALVKNYRAYQGLTEDSTADDICCNSCGLRTDRRAYQGCAGSPTVTPLATECVTTVGSGVDAGYAVDIYQYPTGGEKAVELIVDSSISASPTFTVAVPASIAGYMPNELTGTGDLFFSVMMNKGNPQLPFGDFAMFMVSDSYDTFTSLCSMCMPEAFRQATIASHLPHREFFYDQFNLPGYVEDPWSSGRRLSNAVATDSAKQASMAQKGKFHELIRKHQGSLSSTDILKYATSVGVEGVELAQDSRRLAWGAELYDVNAKVHNIASVSGLEIGIEHHRASSYPVHSLVYELGQIAPIAFLTVAEYNAFLQKIEPCNLAFTGGETFGVCQSTDDPNA